MVRVRCVVRSGFGRAVLLGLVACLSASDALAQADAGTPIAVDDETPLVVDDLPAEPARPDAGAALAEDPSPDAGAAELPPLPEPDELETGIETQPALPRPRTRRRDADLDDLPSAVTTPEIPTEGELAEHVEARAAAVRAGDTAAADLELALIEELRLALAARNVIVVSAQLIQEAKVAMDLGQLEVAAKRVDAAARLSPDLEAAHWMRARVHWRRDKASAPVVLEALRDLFSARLTAFRNQISFLTHAMALLALALVATIGALSILQLLKYMRYPAHDLAQRVPDFIGSGELVILLLVLVLLPFGLGLGLAPSMALALAVVVAYQQPRERWVSWGAMALLALGPLGIWALSPLISFHGSVVDSMAEATSEAFAEKAEARLRRQLGDDAGYASAMVLAHRARLRGEVDAAEAAYRRAVEARPSDPVASNNLGVVLLAQGATDEAEKAFSAAIRKGGGAEPNLNLALVMAERGVFDKSSQYMERARALDEVLVARHTLMTGSSSKRAAVAPFDDGLLWDSLFDVGRDEAPAITAQLWRPISGRLPPWGASAVVVLVTLLGALTVRHERSLSAGCPRCGLPAKAGAQAGLCDQCTSVFLSAVAVEPSLKARKERAVRRHQQRRRWGERLLSIVAGAGHLVGGRPLLGLLFFFPFTVLAVGLLFGEQTIVHPWFVYVDDSAHTAKVFVSAGVIAILSLLSLRSSFER